MLESKVLWEDYTELVLNSIKPRAANYKPKYFIAGNQIGWLKC